MSYLQDNRFYVNDPSPYDRPDFDSRVPGWGPVPRAAGPARWAVGATPTLKRSYARMTAMRSRLPLQPVDSGAASGGGVPWWVWIAVPMALGGAALFAWDQGWLGGSTAAPK